MPLELALELPASAPENVEPGDLFEPSEAPGCVLGSPVGVVLHNGRNGLETVGVEPSGAEGDPDDPLNPLGSAEPDGPMREDAPRLPEGGDESDGSASNPAPPVLIGSELAEP